MITAAIIWLVAGICAAIRGDWSVVMVASAFSLLLLVAACDGFMAERRRRQP